MYRARFPPREVGPRAGLPRAAPLYHGHSNVGFMSSLGRFAVPYVCRVVLVLSQHNAGLKPLKTRNSLNIPTAMRTACMASTVWEVALVHKRISSVNDFEHFLRCPNRSQEMTETCVALDREMEKERQTSENRNDHADLDDMKCYTNQIKYHSDPLLNYHVDAFLSLPARRNVYYEHLPSTKMSYLGSHGIPHIFWRYQSYLELAKLGDYRLLSSNRIPVVNDNITEMVPLLEELGNGMVRLHLREQGLRMAANYSLFGTAEQLVEIHEGPKRTL
eukprot:5438608-Amphidinium_carterae.1